MAIKIKKKVQKPAGATDSDSPEQLSDDASDQEDASEPSDTSAPSTALVPAGGFVASTGGAGFSLGGAGASTAAGGARPQTPQGSPDDEEGAEFVHEPEVLDVGGPGRRLRPMPPVGGDAQSEFVPARQTTWDWMQSHHRPILLSILGFLLISASVVTFRWWSARQAEAQSSAIVGSLKILNQWTAQEADALQPFAKPDKRTPKGPYADARARDKALLESAEAGLSANPDAEISGELRLLAAAAAARLGDAQKANALSAEAAKTLPPTTTKVFALQLQADQLADANNLPDAIALYRQIQGQGPHFAPFALMNIAALEERANKPQEAAESYKQLINGFPQFPFTAEAKHRLSLLVEDADAYLKQSAEPKP